jgi:hypothetical protein
MATEKIHHSDESTKHKSRATQIDNDLKDQENPTEKWKPFLIGGVIILIVICIFALAAYFKDNNDNSTKKESSTEEKNEVKIKWSEDKSIYVQGPTSIRLKAGYLYQCWTADDDGQIKFVSKKTGQTFILKYNTFYNLQGQKINPPFQLTNFTLHCPVGRPQTLVYRDAPRS